ALEVATRFARSVDCRQEHAYQDTDDCDDHQQFHKGKTVLASAMARSVHQHRISPHWSGARLLPSRVSGPCFRFRHFPVAGIRISKAWAADPTGQEADAGPVRRDSM